MAKIYFFITFVISLFICLFAPRHYNFDYSLFCAFAYWFNFIIYLIVKKKKNYFDFDNLFFISFFFVALYYSAVMYETDPYRYIFYSLYFNKNHLPLSSAIALLASNGYLLGATFIKEKRENVFKLSNVKKINTSWLFTIAIVFITLYIISGGYNRLINEYIGGAEVVEENGVSSYFFVFFPVFLFSGIILEFYNLKKDNPDKFFFSKISKYGLVTTGVIFLMFFLIGSRTIPLQIILICLGLYTLLYKPIKFTNFLIFILVGFIGLATVGYLRNVLRSNAHDQKFYLEDSAMDLIVNNRNSYVLIEHVEKKGYSYGVSMLSPVLAPIPFSQSLVINIFDLKDDEMRSALITTKNTFGKVTTWGLGTNIVGDVYLAFGLIGIVILFPLLGYYVNKFRVKSNDSAVSLLFYAILLSYAVYLPRAEYFYFVRYFVWCFIVLYLTLKAQGIKKI